MIFVNNVGLLLLTGILFPTSMPPTLFQGFFQNVQQKHKKYFLK